MLRGIFRKTVHSLFGVGNDPCDEAKKKRAFHGLLKLMPKPEIFQWQTFRKSEKGDGRIGKKMMGTSSGFYIPNNEGGVLKPFQLG